MSTRDSQDYKEGIRLPLWDNSYSTNSSQTNRPTALPPHHVSPRFTLRFRRGCSPVCKYTVPLVLLCLLAIPFLFWELHVETAVYSRHWVKEEVQDLQSLAGCFDPHRVSPVYNSTRTLLDSHHQQVHAGLPLRLGMDCYNFAGTIKPVYDKPSLYIPAEERTQYHTYWRSDLAPFSERQEWMLKSFFATQHIHTSRLILWSNGDLSGNEVLQMWLRRYPDAFTTKVADYQALARGTVLDGSELLRIKDKKAWVDGDLLRLLVLWAYGGVWVDMDSLMTRDLAPLLDQEFVTQWDCYDKLYVPFNGALMRFHRHSPYLCEAFYIMTTSSPPRPGTTDWGATLYLKLWRRLVASNHAPFSILPWCFTDGRSCRLDNRLPDPFTADPSNGQWTMGLGREEGGGLDRVLGRVFSVHLHNQWHKPYPKEGWVERLLLKRYDERLRRRT